MQRGEERHAQSPHQRVGKIIDMQMDHVEVAGAARQRLQEDDVRRQIIAHLRVKS